MCSFWRRIKFNTPALWTQSVSARQVRLLLPRRASFSCISKIRNNGCFIFNYRAAAFLFSTISRPARPCCYTTSIDASHSAAVGLRWIQVSLSNLNTLRERRDLCYDWGGALQHASKLTQVTLNLMYLLSQVPYPQLTFLAFRKLYYSGVLTLVESVLHFCKRIISLTFDDLQTG